MLLVGVMTAKLSLDTASQAWSEICRPVVGQKTAGFPALEWQHLLLTNSAPSEQQRPGFIVALWRVW